VVSAALVLLILSVAALAVAGPGLSTRTWLSIAALGLVAFVGERMAVPLMTFDDESASHSVGSVAAIAAIVVLPWYAAIPLLPLAIVWTQRRRPAMKTAFNASHTALAVSSAALVFWLAGGARNLTAPNLAGGGRAIGILAAVSLVYFASGSSLVSTMVALATRQHIRDVYRSNHIQTILQEITTIGLGLMLGGFWLYNPAFTPLVGLPLVMAYFSIDTFVRIQQETRSAVLAMADSIDRRDTWTLNHSKRVSQLAVALGRQLDLSHEQIATIELSGFVHDIGKIGIPGEILNKPGPLTSEERSQMEAHPVIGYEMLRHYKQFRKGLAMVRSHHERWDGEGYPDRIQSIRLPVEARIMCIADAFEAMTADRPYRKAMSSDVAYGRLEQAAGTQFDPELVVAFKSALEALGEPVSIAPALGQVPIAHPVPVAAMPVAPQLVPTNHVVRSIQTPRGRSLHRLPPSTRRCRPAGLSARAEGDA